MDQAGERSQFRSPLLDPSSELGCLQFQYNIVGTDNDSLSVYVEDFWAETQTCMWYKRGATLNRWIAAEAPLQVDPDGKYTVRNDTMNES